MSQVVGRFPDFVAIESFHDDLDIQTQQNHRYHRNYEFALSLQETPDLDERHEQKVKRPRQGDPVVTDSKQEEAAVDGHVLQCAHAS